MTKEEVELLEQFEKMLGDVDDVKDLSDIDLWDDPSDMIEFERYPDSHPPVIPSESSKKGANQCSRENSGCKVVQSHAAGIQFLYCRKHKLEVFND